MRIRNILFAALAASVIACDPTIPVSSVTVVPSDVTVNVGEERQLSVIVSPSGATEKSVIWESSNTNVATVKDGTLKGVAAGSATVTATSVDGGITGSCSVTVVANGGIAAISASL